MTNLHKLTATLRSKAAALAQENSGLAAIEFAMIFPLMGMMLLGTYEFSAGVAVDRKVTIMARTLSDLTQVQTQLQASYQLIVGLNGLTLTKFLGSA